MAFAMSSAYNEVQPNWIFLRMFRLNIYKAAGVSLYVPQRKKPHIVVSTEVRSKHRIPLNTTKVGAINLWEIVFPRGTDFKPNDRIEDSDVGLRGSHDDGRLGADLLFYVSASSFSGCDLTKRVVCTMFCDEARVQRAANLALHDLEVQFFALGDGGDFDFSKKEVKFDRDN